MCLSSIGIFPAPGVYIGTQAVYAESTTNLSHMEKTYALESESSPGVCPRMVAGGCPEMLVIYRATPNKGEIMTFGVNSP